MKTYQLNDDLVFVHPNPEYKTRPYLSVDLAPPAVSNGKVAVWETELSANDFDFGKSGTGTWVIKDDNRDKELYSTSDGTKFEGEYNGIGTLPEGVTDKPRPTDLHTFNGADWVLTEATKAELKERELAQAKQVKLQEINNKAQQFINEIGKLNEVPDFEVQTWVMQSAEAKAWELDNTAPTPTLDLIAAARGVDREELISKALQKAKSYEAVVSHVVGQRQGYEDELKASDTVQDVELIDPIYTMS
ncbi:hypothetical protein AAEX37_01942 [Oligella sp. MSHR50489EDL]|uniref:hypothetical protein n=1 Tax=Oligella sp. MSHR50489EDL TaxID=3139409 RepID=UPI003D81B11E